MAQMPLFMIVSMAVTKAFKISDSGSAVAIRSKILLWSDNRNSARLRSRRICVSLISRRTASANRVNRPFIK